MVFTLLIRRRALRWLLIAYVVTSLPLVVLFLWNRTVRSTFLNIAAHYGSKVHDVRSLHVGDSLTAGGGQWSGRLSGTPLNAINLAGNGYTVSQVRHQLQAGLRYKPTYVCVLAGTNNVCNPYYNEDITVQQYRELMYQLQFANVRVIVTLVPYQASNLHQAAITRLNNRIRKVAHVPNCQIIDLNPTIAPDGHLLPKYTTDGIHFTDAAYDIWARILDSTMSGWPDSRGRG